MRLLTTGRWHISHPDTLFIKSIIIIIKKKNPDVFIWGRRRARSKRHREQSLQQKDELVKCDRSVFKRLLVDTSMLCPARSNAVLHFSHRKSTQITHRMSHFSLVLNVFRLCQAAADGPAARQVQISSPLLPPEWEMLLFPLGAGHRQQAITWPRHWTPSCVWEMHRLDPNWVKLSSGYSRALGIQRSQRWTSIIVFPGDIWAMSGRKRAVSTEHWFVDLSSCSHWYNLLFLLSV